MTDKFLVRKVPNDVVIYKIIKEYSAAPFCRAQIVSSPYEETVGTYTILNKHKIEEFEEIDRMTILIKYFDKIKMVLNKL